MNLKSYTIYKGNPAAKIKERIIKKMKVSLIVSTYNSKDFIKNCLDSVLEQCYNNIEIIIIDGKSTDGTLELLILIVI